MTDATGAATSGPVARTLDGAAAGRVARYLGAAALLAVGIDHLWQYSADSYSVVPTIGTLFALNFASATVVAIGLVAPLQRLRGRWGAAAHALLAVAGIAIALGSLVGLEVSETSGLFGFMEAGYRPAIVLSIALEAVTIALLCAFLDALRRDLAARG
jgi:hypothetical protein